MLTIILTAALAATDFTDRPLSEEEAKAYAQAMGRLAKDVPAERALQAIQAQKAQIEATHDAELKKENDSYRNKNKTIRNRREKGDAIKAHNDKLKELREKRDADLKTLAPLFDVCRKLVDAQKQTTRIDVYVQFHQDKKAAAALTAAARMHAAAVSALPSQLLSIPYHASTVRKALDDGVRQYTVTLGRLAHGYPDAVLPMMLEADKAHREILSKWKPPKDTHPRQSYPGWMFDVWSILSEGMLSPEQEAIVHFWRHEARQDTDADRRPPPTQTRPSSPAQTQRRQ